MCVCVRESLESVKHFECKIAKQRFYVLMFFFQINPQQAVPSLVDGDFSMAESRAIAAYLVSLVVFKLISFLKFEVYI